MKLIRLLTLNNLRHDRRIFIRHVEGKSNVLSDALSRLKFDKFFQLANKTVNNFPDKLTEELWQLTKIWNASMVL